MAEEITTFYQILDFNIWHLRFRFLPRLEFWKLQSRSQDAIRLSLHCFYSEILNCTVLDLRKQVLI